MSRAGSRWLVRKCLFGTFCPGIFVRKSLSGNFWPEVLPVSPSRVILAAFGEWAYSPRRVVIHFLPWIYIECMHYWVGPATLKMRFRSVYAPEHQSHDPPVHFVLLNRKCLPVTPCPEVFARKTLSGKPCPEKLVLG